MSSTDRPAVLYVDDEPINLKVFEASFKGRFRVLTCHSGAAALELLRSRHHEIGVMITDQRMPEMTGAQLLEKVREAYPEMQRMIITAYSDMQAVIDAVNRGQISRYFVKPWVREELSSALDDSLKIFELQIKLRDVELRMLQSERLAAIGQVSAGIAHELVNPVSFVCTNVGNIRAELVDVERYTRSQLATAPNPRITQALDELPVILADVEKGAQLIRQLAVEVRTQARGDDKNDDSELSEVVGFASRLARGEVRKWGEMVIKGPTLKVRGGQVKLTQVLLNLMVNAAQALEGIGRRGRIDVGWEDLSEKGVRLFVKDNGSGIPPELHQRVFEPLFTTRPVGVGTGLGLAICRDLISSVGGTITLQSEQGVGTTIEVWLKHAAPQAG